MLPFARGVGNCGVLRWLGETVATISSMMGPEVGAPGRL